MSRTEATHHFRNRFETATHAQVTLLGRFGEHNSSLSTGILTGDPGGPNLLSLSFDGSVLRFKGKRLSESLSLEVNGEIVSLSNVTFTGAKKVSVAMSAAELRLSTGPNRVRIIDRYGARSNALILDLQQL